jgi:uncharacterized ParB-like nuclease family protein
MNYTYLSENAARQWIDSSTVFDEFCRAQQKALPYAGGMYWKRQGEYDYLVKTSPDNKQIRLGKRCEVTESTYTAFHQHKREAEERLKSLKAALQEAQRVNRALKVGRVPTLVIDVLNVIHEAGLSQYFTVVGTHALYAYETAAKQVVASVSGKMARMVTIDPAVFVNFKRWMAEQTTTRPAAKRRRDILQAAIVQDLMNEKLLLTSDA